MKTREKLTNLLLSKKIILIIILLIPCLGIYAQDYTKTYQEKYEVDKGASLVINNKFGDVKCQAWEENSVSINVTVSVDASSQEKANKVFDKITVELNGTRTRIEGRTTVGSINNADFSIDYDIRMPRWINIDLNNQFGDIYVDETDGLVKINLEYGAMEANAFNGSSTDITIKFSDGEAGFIKTGDLNVEYSEWKSKGAENLKVISRFSEVTLDKLASLNLDSQYDEATIENAGSVIAIGRFSELDFGKITGDFDFDIEYGELDVSYISASFKTGKVRNSFAGADLTFDPAASMTIDAEIEFGELSYPKGKTSLNHITEGYTTQIYKGRIGSSATSASQLTIRSKNSDTSIDFAE
jgi:hypothetical protein